MDWWVGLGPAGASVRRRRRRAGSGAEVDLLFRAVRVGGERSEAFFNRSSRGG